MEVWNGDNTGNKKKDTLKDKDALTHRSESGSITKPRKKSYKNKDRINNLNNDIHTTEMRIKRITERLDFMASEILGKEFPTVTRAPLHSSEILRILISFSQIGSIKETADATGHSMSTVSNYVHLFSILKDNNNNL